jgi:hypothetical protein
MLKALLLPACLTVQDPRLKCHVLAAPNLLGKPLLNFEKPFDNSIESRNRF